MARGDRARARARAGRDGRARGRVRVVPHVVATDVEPTSWADAVVDAHDLPYADASLANLVLFDVFHHLGDPARFLDEAGRTLRPGGRIVLVEPYCSAVSTPLYRRFHHERTDLGVDPFAPDPALGAAMEGNQALPTLAFFRHAAELTRRWPELRLVRRRRFAFVLYPLSGGYSRRPLVSPGLYRPLHVLESVLSPLAPLLAFRCLVVLERTLVLDRVDVEVNRPDHARESAQRHEELEEPERQRDLRPSVPDDGEEG